MTEAMENLPETEESEVISAGEEIDLSGEGLQEGRYIFLVDGYEVIEKPNGVLHQFTFVNDEALPFGSLDQGFWFTHSNEDAQRIGRGQLKRLVRSATGQVKYNSRTGTPVIGRNVSAVLYEDDNGFMRLKGFRAVPAETNGNGTAESDE